MTLNSLELTECVRKIHTNAGDLDRLIRDAKISNLLQAIAEIENEARKAGWIMNDLIYKK